jgi:hypothetical protein
MQQSSVLNCGMFLTLIKTACGKATAFIMGIYTILKREFQYLFTFNTRHLGDLKIASAKYSCGVL